MTRESIIRKVQALLAKTSDNGCTESEAIAAAAKAAEMIDEHDLQRSEIDLQQDVYGENRQQYGQSKIKPVVRQCMYWVSRYTQTKSWWQGSNAVFFGEKNDSEFAHYLMELLVKVSESELRLYRATTETDFHPATLRASFIRGFSVRINDRLRDMVEARKQKYERSDGTSLMVVKDQLVKQKLNELGYRFKNVRSRSTIGSISAYSAGQRAGDRAALGGAVSKPGGRLQ